MGVAELFLKGMQTESVEEALHSGACRYCNVPGVELALRRCLLTFGTYLRTRYVRV